MRFITSITFIFFIINGCSQRPSEFGKAIVADYHQNYENEDIYFPHDAFKISDVLENPLSIEYGPDLIIVKNVFNSGFGGHKVSIAISTDLQIDEVEYGEWSDVINGSETKYKVEKIILNLNKNPFTDSLVSGFYSLQIRNEFKAGDLLKSEGVSDTITYSVFHGKFKNYSKEEIQKGKEWVIDQSEIKYGIKDSSGIYFMPDSYAEFEPGDTTLKEILYKIEVNPGDVKEVNSSALILSFIVDENGEIDKNQLQFNENIKSEELLQEIKKIDVLFENWKPATYKNKNVKSEVFLPIRIKK